MNLTQSMLVVVVAIGQHMWRTLASRAFSTSARLAPCWTPTVSTSSASSLK